MAPRKRHGDDETLQCILAGDFTTPTQAGDYDDKHVDKRKIIKHKALLIQLRDLQPNLSFVGSKMTHVFFRISPMTTPKHGVRRQLRGKTSLTKPRNECDPCVGIARKRSQKRSLLLGPELLWVGMSRLRSRTRGHCIELGRVGRDQTKEKQL